jgi:acetyl-CoA carboxylase biotin carboxyl carrier protein
VLEHEDVEEILKLLDATPIEEFALDTGRFRLTLRRTAEGSWTQERKTRSTLSGTDASALSAAAAAPATSAAAIQAGTVGADVPGIRSPLVGTYYRAPKPGAPPFVDVGSIVGPDAIVGIVETMKLMTSIYAGQSGQIGKVLVTDGQLVEQNQLLMTLLPMLS